MAAATPDDEVRGICTQEWRDPVALHMWGARLARRWWEKLPMGDMGPMETPPLCNWDLTVDPNSSPLVILNIAEEDDPFKIPVAEWWE